MTLLLNTNLKPSLKSAKKSFIVNLSLFLSFLGTASPHMFVITNKIKITLYFKIYQNDISLGLSLFIIRRPRKWDVNMDIMIIDSKNPS